MSSEKFPLDSAPLHGPLNEAALADQVRRRGFALVEGCVGEEVLDSLLGEVRQLHRDGGPGVSTMLGNVDGPARRLQRSRLDRAAAPTLVALLESPALRRVTQAAVGACESYNEDVVTTHDVDRPPNVDVHFDLRRALKCFLYLTDCDDGSGALRYAAGTHLTNAAERAAWIAAGRRHRELPNVAAPDEAIELQTLSGAAGTLILFDTEGWHTASRLLPGHERRVIRAACPLAHQPVKRPPLLSRQWMRESRLNPARLYRSVPLVPGRGSSAGTAKRR
ncbi:MAG: phytanoyl-CoA dioxygenase family protein [Myxococcota bacterium]|nr:phytanoyl-CoA dioxygenase family protein [Myxococcota bacterium]